jgi:copper transport protein
MPRRRGLAAVRVRRTGVGVAIGLLVLATWAAPAAAHAELLRTTPAAGSVVRHSPAAVTLAFDEAVEIDFGSIRVYAADGARVDQGGTHYANAANSSVAISLPHLDDGAYVVAWHVVSDDSHPVHGAFVFSVGTSRGLPAASTLASALAAASGSTAVGVVFWVVRLTAFAGLLALVGLAAVALAAAPSTLAATRVRRSLWTAFALLALATLAAVAIQGPYAATLPLGDALRPSLVREVLATRFGRVQELRVLLLVATAPVLWALTRARTGAPPRWLVATAAVLGVGLLVTPGLAGHATTGPAIPAGFALDVVHLGSAGLWLGGLVLLACVLVPGADGVGDDAAVERAALRVSSLALAAVVVVIASGTLQAVRQVGSFGALTSTTYGRLLLWKVGLVAALIALGAVSRRLLRRRDAEARRGALVRTVVAELAIALGVLGVTAALVNAPPAREQSSLPYTQSFTTLGVQANVILSPAAAGVSNVLHVYVVSATTGLPHAVPAVTATVAFPPDHLGPLPVPLRVAGVGHYRAQDLTFAVSGTWVLRVTVRTSPSAATVTPLLVPVR